ncbi:MAG: hypothetical protein A2360_03980, partial [Candidatus Staskawiczbacteria bacterium RIFOXYB1_FULL_32_11]
MITINDRILFLNLDYGEKSVSVKDTMAGLGEVYSHKFKMPILDFIVSATVLKEADYNVKVVDNELDKVEHKELIKKIIQENYNFIFLRTSVPTIDKDLFFADLLKKSNKKIKICLFANFLDKFIGVLSKHNIDFFISGEVEFAFLDIKNKLSKENIKGIGFKNNSKFVYTGMREFSHNLDNLPLPDWSLVPYKKYSFLTCLASRGCPYNCGYCPYPVYQGSVWRTRSVENIIEELRKLLFVFKVDFVRFRDPEFTINRQRTVDICNQLINNKINITWQCETRLDLLDSELLDIMKKAGCNRICFGVETINEETAKLVNRKRIGKKQIDIILNHCEKIGIKTSGFYIIGLPCETIESTIDLINFSLSLNTSFNEFTIATPYVGTPLAKWAEDKKLITNQFDPSLYSGREVAMTNGILTENQLKVLHKFANISNKQKTRRKDIIEIIKTISKKPIFIVEL